MPAEVVDEDLLVTAPRALDKLCCDPNMLALGQVIPCLIEHRETEQADAVVGIGVLGNVAVACGVGGVLLCHVLQPASFYGVLA